MPEVSVMPKKDLLCNQYRRFQEIGGIRLSGLKKMLDYSFKGFVLKIEKNHKYLKYDIYLMKKNKENKKEIDLKEVEKFRGHYQEYVTITVLNQEDEYS